MQNSNSTIQTINASSYLEKIPPQPNQILVNTFDLGDKLAIISSSKQKKSMFVGQFALALSSSKKRFLDWYIPEPRRVLMVQLEVKTDHFHRRIRRLSGAMGISANDLGDRFQIINGRGLNLTGAQGIEKIRKVAAKHKPEVIVIDPLYKIADGVENAAEDMKIILAEFDRLAEDTGAAIVYVHHDGKGAAGEKQITDRGSGSGVLGRDYDAAIVLTAHDRVEGATVIETVLRNYAPQDASVIVWSCNDSGDAYSFQTDNSIPPEKKTQRTKAQPPPFSAYVATAQKILGDFEKDVQIFKSDFKDITGLADNRIKEFLSWATAGNMPFILTRDERSRGKNKRWLKFAENRA
jgi:hypothetical protein